MNKQQFFLIIIHPEKSKLKYWNLKFEFDFKFILTNNK
jgi:hypothetical protein